MKAESHYKFLLLLFSFFPVADALPVFVILLKQKRMMHFTWSHASSNFLIFKQVAVL